MRPSGRVQLAAAAAEPSAAGRPAAGWLAGGTIRDIALTAMLILACAAIFVAAPLAALDYEFAVLAVNFLVLPYTLLVIVVARGRTAVCVATAGAACVSVSAITHGLDGSSGGIWMDAASLVGVSLCCVVIAMAVVAAGLVTVHRILGAVVLYLNTALAFGMLYRLLWETMPLTFAGLPADAGGKQAFASLVYFSFTTLTSTGYGDIAPLHPLVRSLANFEAVIGQLYPATLVASLLTQHLDWRRHRNGAGPE